VIKFKFTRQDKTPGLGFGLSAENVKRLQAGQPIVIDCTEMGVNAQVMIFYGETEAAIYEDLKEFIGKDTKVSGV
jgi:hypothetical protein